MFEKFPGNSSPETNEEEKTHPKGNYRRVFVGDEKGNIEETKEEILTPTEERLRKLHERFPSNEKEETMDEFFMGLGKVSKIMSKGDKKMEATASITFLTFQIGDLIKEKFDILAPWLLLKRQENKEDFINKLKAIFSDDSIWNRLSEKITLSGRSSKREVTRDECKKGFEYLLKNIE